MHSLSLMSEDAQIALFLVVTENAMKGLEDENLKKSAKQALDKCWEYFEKKYIKGDSLYDLIGSEDDNLVYLQMEAKTENDIRILDCVIDSVAFTCRKAYEAYNENLPQAVESADFTLYDHLVEQYILINSNNKETLRKIETFFNNHYIEIEEKDLNVVDLKRLIQNELL